MTDRKYNMASKHFFVDLWLKIKDVHPLIHAVKSELNRVHLWVEMSLFLAAEEMGVET